LIRGVNLAWLAPTHVGPRELQPKFEPGQAGLQAKKLGPGPTLGPRVFGPWAGQPGEPGSSLKLGLSLGGPDLFFFLIFFTKILLFFTKKDTEPRAGQTSRAFSGL